MREVFHSALNQLGFTWRNFAALPGPSYSERPEDKRNLFKDPTVTARAEELARRYDLKAIYEASGRERWKETLAFLEWLEVFAAAEPGWIECLAGADDFRWLDVGSRNWTYGPALERFIRIYRPEAAFTLDGLELDPNRRFANLRLRRQEAEAHIRGIPEARYHGGDILVWQEPVDVITHFLPFVFEDPLLDWGLPLNAFHPAAILAHEFRLLKPGGHLLLVNQDEDEAQEQERLLKELAEEHPVRYNSMGRLPDSFMKYRYPRYGWLCRKD